MRVVLDSTPPTPISIYSSVYPLRAEEALVVYLFELLGLAVGALVNAVTLLSWVFRLPLTSALSLPCVPCTARWWLTIPTFQFFVLLLLLDQLGCQFLLCCHEFMGKGCTLPPVHHLAPCRPALVHLCLDLAVVQSANLPRITHVV